ncbi:hypothetical protein [Streptomyces yerevanensis]|uniref:hypothetical protein n=1 Tax=Streptomyces yerevanensis TaxID=66378 RepID=UPI0012FEBEFF|nr:hypothetical protein [Streptomyces yerevanensis]
MIDLRGVVCARETTESKVSYDAHDGVDYGFVPYARRPNGDPIFADPEVFTAAVRPREQAPGWTLLHALTQDGAEPTGTGT